jgi:MoxR-like ATPase
MNEAGGFYTYKIPSLFLRSLFLNRDICILELNQILRVNAVNDKLKVQQIEELYRQDYRNCMDDSFMPEAKQGDFFERYRRTTAACKEKTLNVMNNEIFDVYKNFKKSEHQKWSEIIDEINTEIAYEKFFLNWERRIAKENYQSNHCISNAATRYRVDRIAELKEKLLELYSHNKEAWEVYHLKKYQSDIRNKENHKMIDVSYVMSAKERVIDALDNGLPVYIVGHLGGGKTQLAMDAAKEFAISKRIQEDIEDLMTTWYYSNKNATDEQVLKQFRYYMKITEEKYRKGADICDEEILDQIQPLFISGSHDLTYEDMFVEKTLTLKTGFSKGSYLNFFEQIFSDYRKMEAIYQEELNKMSREEQTRIKLLILNSFSDMIIADNSAFGTEVKKVEREILRAAKEGRPVIVDELNTIAMQNLIGLNDLLQRQAGETAYITGVGPVFIKPGFAFIGTGNLSSNMVNYEGTNELNPAFKSRFITIEYNYLPQSIKGTLMKQESPEKNELFEVVLSYIADQKGSVHLPDIDRNIDELFRLCQLSKLTQNVFIGKWKDNFSGEEEIDQSMGDLELKEAVLSIRNIIHVLDAWNLGEEKDLTKALWDGFISSITNPDDQNYILSQAVRYGFFKKQDGWQIKDRAVGDAGVTYNEIRQTPYKYYRGETETYSDLDIIHILYGMGPREQNLPKSIEDYIASSKNLMDMDTYLQYVSKVKKFERQLDLTCPQSSTR